MNHEILNHYANLVWAYLLLLVVGFWIGWVWADRQKKKKLKTPKKEEFQYNFIEKISSPYLFNVKNLTKETKKAIIFGHNKFVNSVNYGSDIGIEISNGVPYCTYIEALHESALYPFEVDKIRLISLNIKQLNTKFEIKDHRAKGTEMIVPVITANHYEEQKRKGALQDTILDIDDIRFKAQSSSWLEFEILPETELAVFIFPKKVLNVH